MKKIIKRLKIKLFGSLNRWFLKNKNFTIISNNCWGGFIYQKYNLLYNSPTIGLYFFADDYIEFLKKFPQILKTELTFISVYESKYKDYLLKKDRDNDKLIIGKLCDVEIIFLHYKSTTEAKEKWERRKERINLNNIIIKMNDQNLCSEKNYLDFINLPYENKIFFTTNPAYNHHSCILFKNDDNQFVTDDIKAYKKYFNVTKYINEVVK